MTPKEKAEDLVSRFIIYTNLFNPDNPNNNGWEKDIDSAKQCALIAVDEIMESNADFAFSLNMWGDNQSYVDCENYWNEVKTEIEKL